jgi:hypothetical protein
MRTKYAHYSDTELLSIAYAEIKPEDELGFELLQRLEKAVYEAPTDADA